MANEFEFSYSSIENLKDALSHGMKIKKKCSQIEIKETIQNLNIAFRNMENKEGIKIELPKSENFYDINRGFHHPGGLIRQEDFDRIKKQLEEENKKVTSAYDILKNAQYAQHNVVTYPSETIIRGGNGENYINAARGASIAFQNALR